MPTVLVDNSHSKVVADEFDVLHCRTAGRGLTIALFIVGMLLIYVSIVVIGWDLPQGRMHSSSLLSGAGIFLTGILFQWRCMRRQKEMGQFEIDKSTRVLRKIGRPIGLTFDAVSRVRLAVNPLGVFMPAFFPYMPMWLFIHFKDGQKYRIAMGKKDALAQVLGWLKESGITEVDWVN